jgi:hypothetical protein
MAAKSFGKQVASAFNREKPNSSITQWVDILTTASYEDEAYDGIPEIVDSINLQPTGPTEASRALRKKLKHGNAHNQYRALVILKALVENCGHKFQTTFADGQLTDALKHLATDLGTDHKVKKKLLSVLASWHNQFKTDPSMTLVAGLYRQCRPVDRRSQQQTPDADFEKMFSRMGGGGGDASTSAEYERKRKEEEEKQLAKKKAKEEKSKKAEEEAKRKKNTLKRQPFDFEKDKPQVLTTIANASQAANNLVNAITLVNPETDSLLSNERVQECLGKAKLLRKPLVRYIQLVENEEVIGTLIDTNERIIAALEMYDKLTTSSPTDPFAVDSAVQAGLAAANISHTDGEVTKLQEQQRAAVSRAVKAGSYRGKGRQDSSGGDYIHPDLQDLNFGPLGSEQHGLPPPLRPSLPEDDGEGDSWDRRGSLSDFSDFEDESDEDSARIQRKGQDRVTVSDNDEDRGIVHYAGGSGHNNLVDVDDPFADPFSG